MSRYLKQLQERYEWSKQAKSNYFKIRRRVIAVSNQINKLAKKEAKKDQEISNLTSQVKDEAAALLNDDINNEITIMGKRGLEELESISESEFTSEYAESMHIFIKKNVKVSKRRLLFLLRKRANTKPVNQEYVLEANNLAKRLRLLAESHMSKSYKEFSPVSFSNDLNSLIRNDSFDFQDQMAVLQNLVSLDDWNEPERPNAEEIIEILHSIRQPAMYISRGYTVLEYTKPVYKSMSYFQRALREKREFVGTANAYERLISNLDALEGYYQSHYVQAGGKPKNYHGHYAGEKP